MGDILYILYDDESMMVWMREFNSQLCKNDNIRLSLCSKKYSDAN